MGRYNINAKFLGPDSTLYPFKNSTFDELTAEYIPVINKLQPESKIRDLFEKGKDFNIPGQGSRDELGPLSSGVGLRPLFRHFNRPPSESIFESASNEA